MNIFKDSKHILGFFEPGSPKNSIQSIFKLANEIRGKLGTQGYLLDSYLSLILEAANSTLAYESADEGFEAGSQLHTLCFDVMDGKEVYKDHPFYEAVKKECEERRYAYQEKHTIMSLHYIFLSDPYLEHAFQLFWMEQERNLERCMDTIKLNNLYEKITLLIGEDLMEQLNQLIKERFFIVTVVAGFMQGFTNDLLYCLIYRDDETNKRVFQLLMDHLSKEQ